jgi:hypothetical protein
VLENEILKRDLLLLGTTKQLGFGRMLRLIILCRKSSTFFCLGLGL